MKKQFTADEKAKIALAAIKGERTIVQLAGMHGVHPNVIGLWKKTAQEGLPTLFADKRQRVDKEKDDLIASLYEIIGKRDAELEWVKKVSR
jgi:transposase-like protein